jgi:hypothetical protein
MCTVCAAPPGSRNGGSLPNYSATLEQCSGDSGSTLQQQNAEFFCAVAKRADPPEALCRNG